MRLSLLGWCLTAVSASAIAFLTPDVADLVGDVAGPSLPGALVALASLAMLLLSAWSLLAAAAILLGGSSRLVAAVTPAVLRRALLAGAAGALVVGPAHASQVAAPDVQPHIVTGLTLPDRPHVTVSSAPKARVDQATVEQGSVQVRPGDTLWAIAARSLPADATDAAIAHATSEWHRVNRDVIGDDPDLVPRQLLEPPTRKDHP